MSGNVVLLGFAAAGVVSSIRALLSLAGFFIGAALGGKLGTMVASGRRRRLIIVAGTFERVLDLCRRRSVDWVRSAGIRLG